MLPSFAEDQTQILLSFKRPFPVTLALYELSKLWLYFLSFSQNLLCIPPDCTIHGAKPGLTCSPCLSFQHRLGKGVGSKSLFIEGMMRLTCRVIIPSLHLTALWVLLSSQDYEVFVAKGHVVLLFTFHGTLWSAGWAHRSTYVVFAEMVFQVQLCSSLPWYRLLKIKFSLLI